MAHTGHHLAMYMTAGTVRLPATIRGVREALPEEERAAFTAEIENAAADELRTVLVRWAMNIPTEHDDAERALVERIRSGDLSGVTFAEDLDDDEYRSAG
ncbi:hypothetical protein [Streptomyces albipurpureus]|uniref:Uncharacterized protein n=1 Tax=Streptomyces albipurpureus TaxID=2897419 RepID=A0ABT0UWE7_9ACTN|nr:hypothetical protein [Streptomyces sp. CWNU-1]MCM2392913.1 hypothetical protein [Streptomyces sp. CWNU-1]